MNPFGEGARELCLELANRQTGCRQSSDEREGDRSIRLDGDLSIEVFVLPHRDTQNVLHGNHVVRTGGRRRRLRVDDSGSKQPA